MAILAIWQHLALNTHPLGNYFGPKYTGKSDETGRNRSEHSFHGLFLESIY